MRLLVLAVGHARGTSEGALIDERMALNEATVEKTVPGHTVRIATSIDGRPFVTYAADGLLVAGSGTTPYLAPEKALPATHWNVAELNGPWINPQDGKPMPLTVTPRGQDMVPRANGSLVRATHYALTGEATLDDWYSDDADIWTALRAIAKDGSIIDYRRVIP